LQNRRLLDIVSFCLLLFTFVFLFLLRHDVILTCVILKHLFFYQSLNLVVLPNVRGSYDEIAWQDNSVIEFLEGQFFEDVVLAL
jgi:hypothetical protein